MITNLEKYFLPEHTFYLNEINYKIIDGNSNESELNCTDNLSVEVNDSEGVRVVFTRTLKFVPESIFELSVSFGALLKFDESQRGNINWHEINMAEEIRDNGMFVLHNLIARSSLLIAEITASFGQSPIVLPPIIAGETK